MIKKSISTAILLFSAMTANAGDRIGNGGGLWTCNATDGSIQRGELVDLFEARQEFQLYVPTTGMGTTPQELYVAARKRIAEVDPVLSGQLENYFVRVEKNLIYVDAVLEPVDDSLWRISPLPTDCRNGMWKYTQFANFTTYDRVLIRNDLWNNPAISSLDKAALLVHETVYLYLRETAGDANSVRTRQITGLLFSNLPASEIQSRIAAILNPSSGGSSTGHLAQTACRLTNTYSSHTFVATGENEVDAQFGALSACQKAGNPGYCEENKLACDSFISSLPVISCRVDNQYSSKSFLGKGRSKIEAEGLALIECEQAGNPGYCSIQRCSQ